MPEEPRDKDIIKRLAEAGLKNFTAHKVNVQDGVVISLILRVDDKEVAITR